jgi:hypothetical protein
MLVDGRYTYFTVGRQPRITGGVHGRPRPSSEGASDAVQPDHDPFIAAAREQSQLNFKRRTAKAKKAVKATSCD